MKTLYSIVGVRDLVHQTLSANSSVTIFDCDWPCSSSLLLVFTLYM